MIPTTFTFLFLTACAFAADNYMKVNVTVYYETLCPDSQVFITKQLVPVWEKLMDNIDLTLVPFGKSTVDRNNTAAPKISCHHGEEECVGNKIHSCILEGTAIPNANIQVRIIDCLMKEAKRGDPYPTKSCVMKVGGLDVDKVSTALETCANSTRGDDLLIKNGDKTDTFEKPLSNVPAVQIKNAKEKDKDAVSDFQSALCKATPSNKPNICSKKNSSPILVGSFALPLIAAVLLVKL